MCCCRKSTARPGEVSSTPLVIRPLRPALPLPAPPLQPLLDLSLSPALLRLVVDALRDLLGQITVVHAFRFVGVGVTVARAVAFFLHEPGYGVAQVQGNLWRVLAAHVV